MFWVLTEFADKGWYWEHGSIDSLLKRIRNTGIQCPSTRQRQTAFGA